MNSRVAKGIAKSTWKVFMKNISKNISPKIKKIYLSCKNLFEFWKITGAILENYWNSKETKNRHGKS